MRLLLGAFSPFCGSELGRMVLAVHFVVVTIFCMKSLYLKTNLLSCGYLNWSIVGKLCSSAGLMRTPFVKRVIGR